MSELRLKARSRGISALLLAAVLLLSAAAGFLARRLSAPQPATLVAAPTVPTPATATSGPAAAVAPVRKVPEALPQLALTGLDGASHRLTEWQGRPVIVNFWATWCDPCLREIPLLKTLRREHASERLQVVGVAVDSAEAVREYAGAHGIDYPVLMGQQGGLAAVSAFGMETVLPFSVFADSKGRILALKVGELRREEAELILRKTRDVDVGTLTVAGARDQISNGLSLLRAAPPPTP